MVIHTEFKPLDGGIRGVQGKTIWKMQISPGTTTVLPHTYWDSDTPIKLSMKAHVPAGQLTGIGSLDFEAASRSFVKGGDDFVKTPELIFLTELDAHLLGLEVDNSWSVSVDTVSYYTELIKSDYMGILEKQYAKSWEQISKEFPDIVWLLTNTNTGNQNPGILRLEKLSF